MPSHSDLALAAAQAEDTSSLLDHIAWTDVIRPRLATLRESYIKQLVAHDLGAPLPAPLTREHLAGRIYGIDYICSILESILSRGARAAEELREIGFSLE
jgi:hypothetical protein